MRKEAVLRQIALEDRLIADAERCIASQLDRVEESTSSERPRLLSLLVSLVKILEKMKVHRLLLKKELEAAKD
jgi:hypothetical protein